MCYKLRVAVCFFKSFFGRLVLRKWGLVEATNALKDQNKHHHAHYDSYVNLNPGSESSHVDAAKAD